MALAESKRILGMVGPGLVAAVAAMFDAGCDTSALDDADEAGDDEGSGTESEDEDSDEDDDEGDEDDDGGATGLDPEQACHQAIPRGSVLRGDPCASDPECQSLVCEVFATFNEAGAGTCVAAPTDCRTRAMGVLFDFRTETPVPGAELAVIPATNAAGGVETSPDFVTMTSDADGRFDETTAEKISSFIAVLGRIRADGYVTSANGLAGPRDVQGNYDPAIFWREWWVVAESDLGLWNASLDDDPELEEVLPLDHRWDVIGVIRRAEVGTQPLAGAILRPTNTGSSAKVRYLNSDGVTFNRDATSESGLFVVLGSGPGESYTVEAEGWVGRESETIRAGVFPDAIFIMKVWMIPASQ